MTSTARNGFADLGSLKHSPGRAWRGRAGTSGPARTGRVERPRGDRKFRHLPHPILTDDPSSACPQRVSKSWNIQLILRLVAVPSSRTKQQKKPPPTKKQRQPQILRTMMSAPLGSTTVDRI